jgi:hypothetical protein
MNPGRERVAEWLAACGVILLCAAALAAAAAVAIEAQR